MPFVRIAAVLLSLAAVLALGARAQPMPALPEAGRDAAAGPSLPDMRGSGEGPGGVAPARIEETLRRTATGAPPVLRGPAEQALFNRFARSVVLIVTKERLGSGAVVRPDGTILTSAHIVGDAKSVGIIFKPLAAGAVPRESDAVKGVVVRVDEMADLALVRVARLPGDVRPLAMGAMDRVRMGQPVHAIGHPFGEVWSYAKGVVAQVLRNFAWTNNGAAYRADVVQAQMPMSPGNAGAPLFDDAGQLIGVSTSGPPEASVAVAASEALRVLAMTADRRVQRAHTTGFAKRPSCAPIRMSAKRTRKDDGTLVIFDGDCNGRADTTLVLPDSRAQPTLMMVDRNENGKTDVVYVDKDGDMRFDEALYDTNEDGRTDLIGYDLDDGLEPGRIVLARA